MDFSSYIMISCKYVRGKAEMELKYDTEERKIQSQYDPARSVVNFVTIIQLKDVYRNIGDRHSTAIYHGDYIVV